MVMKKFINNPENVVSELLQGYVLAYPNKVRLAGDNLVVRAVPKAWGKVGIVTLGGSGHEPGLSGFVGEGMLDISVPGLKREVRFGERPESREAIRTPFSPPSV